MGAEADESDLYGIHLAYIGLSALAVVISLALLIRHLHRRAASRVDRSPARPRGRLVWLVVALLLVLGIAAVWGATIIGGGRTEDPTGTCEIDVLARSGIWQFEYSTGWVEDVLADVGRRGQASGLCSWWPPRSLRSPRRKIFKPIRSASSVWRRGTA